MGKAAVPTAMSIPGATSRPPATANYEHPLGAKGAAAPALPGRRAAAPNRYAACTDKPAGNSRERVNDRRERLLRRLQQPPAARTAPVPIQSVRRRSWCRPAITKDSRGALVLHRRAHARCRAPWRTLRTAARTASASAAPRRSLARAHLQTGGGRCPVPAPRRRPCSWGRWGR